jgi:hypothetical protein
MASEDQEILAKISQLAGEFATTYPCLPYPSETDTILLL